MYYECTMGDVHTKDFTNCSTEGGMADSYVSEQ